MTPWRWPWNTQPGNWSRSSLFLPLLSLLFLSLPAVSWADWSPLINRLAADGFNEQDLQELFSRPQTQFEPGAMGSKLEALLRNRTPSGEAPAPSTPKNGVMKSLLKGPLLAKAKSFLNENRPVLETIYSLYGVPGGNRRFHPADRNPPRRVPGRKGCLQPPGKHGALYGS